MTTLTAKVLERAREIIQQGWTQGVLAEDENGGVRLAYEPEVRKCCLIGAVRRAEWQLVKGADSGAFQRLRSLLGPATLISEWNDAKGRTKTEVLVLITSTLLTL